MAGTTPRDVNASLNLYHILPEDNSEKFILYLHFSEVQTLSANDIREFNVMWDENIIHTAYSPKLLQSDTIYNISPIRCINLVCYLELVWTERSTLPPLVNAIEAFRVLEFPYAETNPNDGISLFLPT